MLALNLISPEQKKFVNSIKIYHLVYNIVFICLSIVMITGVILFFTNLLMKNYQDSLQSQVDSERAFIEQGKSASLDDVIRQLNDQLTRAQLIQKTYIQWSSFTKKFTDTVPAGITLNNVQFNAATQSFRLTGIAKGRTELLAWVETLKSFPYFASVTSPVSNLSQKENIAFEITGQITSAIYEAQ